MSAPARIHETHISWITLIGDRAYKLLKPVRTGFLDHRAREDRRAACLRELEVNRRFAPGVYLGVLDVVDADGAPRDHLLEMVRLPDDRRLSALVGTPGAALRVAEVARAVAAAHADSPRSPAIDRAGERTHLCALWHEGWEQLRAVASGVIGDDEIARAEHMAARFLDGRGPLLRARIEAGWIRDGHGDLLADDIYCMDDAPCILDCLAFDDRLRHGDVLGDVAFLAMDLESLGHPDAAERLMAEWSAALGEDHPESLAHHHVAYRAHVRAKVAAIRHSQGDEPAAERARRLHALCLDHLDRGRVRMVLVGGTPGTGKSTVAAAVAQATGWPVLRTDALRPDVVGPPGAHGDMYGRGRYADEARDRVYTRMRDLAATELGMGRSVVLDASWSSESQRRAARDLARDLAADMVELHCVAPAAVAEARIAVRRADDPSEATATVAARMRAAFDDWPAAAVVPTDGALSASRDAALAAVGPH